MRRKTVSFTTKLVAITLSLGLARFSFGAPGDVLETPAPVLGADPPKARSLGENDYSVSTQTGSLSYGYPITVPPGRNGMAPSVALSYSSQGDTYGGVAAGWTLGQFPMIQRDPTQSRIARHEGEPTRYVSSLCGGNRLIAVNEPATAADVAQAYRCQFDSSYARYEQLTLEGRWRVRTTDGVVHHFDDRPPHYTARSRISKSVDQYGNTVEYLWEPVTQPVTGFVIDWYVSEIRYTENFDAGLRPHARVLFDYQPALETCGNSRVPIGGKLTYRNGVYRIEGAKKLLAIRTQVQESGSWRTVREVDIGYNEDVGTCSPIERHTPYRELASIQETAYSPTGQATQLPAATFEYGSTDRQINTAHPDFTIAQHLGSASEPALALK